MPGLYEVRLRSGSQPSAGAIVATADDVADFYRALLSGQVLKPELLEAMEMTHAQKKYDVPGQRYGLGLMSWPTSCGIAWGHVGAFPGYQSVAFTNAHGTRQAVLMAIEGKASIPASTSVSTRLTAASPRSTPSCNSRIRA